MNRFHVSHFAATLPLQVMGGASFATVTIDEAKGVALFEGEVVDVPGLNAPGYCSFRSDLGQTFPDLTGSIGLQVTVNSLEGTELKSYKLTVNAVGGVDDQGSR